MLTNNHQVNYTIIPANLQANILKVKIDTYTMQPHYLISIPEINFEYWTFESNLNLWRDCKQFTEMEKDIFKAGSERARQVRKFYNNEINISELDRENPLKKYPALIN